MNFIVKRMARQGSNKSCRKQSAQVVLKCCQQANAFTEPGIVCSLSQRAPGGVATCDPEASNNEASPKKSSQKHERPSTDQLIKPIAEGLAYRFLRSQPRVLGSGSLHRARPR